MKSADAARQNQPFRLLGGFPDDFLPSVLFLRRDSLREIQRSLMNGTKEDTPSSTPFCSTSSNLSDFKSAWYA